jgi:hypothetical protein
MSRFRTRTLAITTTTLLLAGAGGAFAYIQATGTGGGTAATSALAPIELTAAVTGLGPTTTEVPIVITYRNSNKFKVTAQYGLSVARGSLPTPACDGESITVKDLPGPVVFAPDKLVDTPLAFDSLTGGTIKWTFSETADQSSCLTALAGVGGGISLTLGMKTAP